MLVVNKDTADHVKKTMLLHWRWSIGIGTHTIINDGKYLSLIAFLIYFNSLNSVTYNQVLK